MVHKIAWIDWVTAHLCIQIIVMRPSTEYSLIWFIMMQKIAWKPVAQVSKDLLIQFIVILAIVWTHCTSAGLFIDSIYCDGGEFVLRFPKASLIRFIVILEIHCQSDVPMIHFIYCVRLPQFISRVPWVSLIQFAVTIYTKNEWWWFSYE